MFRTCLINRRGRNRRDLESLDLNVSQKACCAKEALRNQVDKMTYPFDALLSLSVAGLVSVYQSGSSYLESKEITHGLNYTDIPLLRLSY